MVCHSARESVVVKEVRGFQEVRENRSMGVGGKWRERQSVMTTELIGFPERVGYLGEFLYRCEMVLVDLLVERFAGDL